MSNLRAMSLGNDRQSGMPSERPSADDGVPPTDKTKMIAAGVLLLIPIIALMWVPSYARETPRLWGFPFFFWYQFLWVFICSGMTWCAYLLTISARKGGRR